MGGDRFFWTFFGSIWLIVGLGFLAGSLGINVFGGPAQLDDGMPLWAFTAAGILATGAGGAIIYFARKAAARDERLMQSGIAFTATVVDVRRSPIEINRQSRWNVVYRYEYTKGRSLEGKSRALPAEAVWGLKPGDKVAIKVNPLKPEESLLLGPAATPS